MFKLNTLASAVALALVLPSTAFAEFEISGEAKIEYSLFSSEGTVTGATEAHEAGDPQKSEVSLKLFINSDIGEDSSFHAEVLLANDGEAASDRLEGGEEDGQYEVLREFYFDTNLGDWYFRLGKQQVVWGTADGIKLLDIINPTDFRELNQNAAEDSRLPVWMINAETDLANGANIQFILSEAKANFISGLGEDGADDAGAPFLFKGVDTITGKTNGFLNIGRDMGKTAGVFQTLLAMGGLGGLDETTPTSALSTGPLAFTTVSGFTALGTPGNQTFTRVGQGLNAAGTIDGDNDGFNETVSVDAFGDGSGLLQFAVPSIQTSAGNQALLNVIFLPFMNGLKTGNRVLNAAANGAGDLLGTPTSGFVGYLGQLQAAFGAGRNFDSNGDGTLDLTNAQIGTALNTLGGQIFAAVAQGMGLSTASTDRAATTGAIAANLGVNPPTNNPADADTIAFNNALQAAGIQGMQNSYFSNSSTNQFSGTLDVENPVSTFDYMGNTTFGTFDTFIGMKTDYRNKHENESDQNLGFRYKNATESGTSYSLNFAYRLDSNPYVDLHWEDSAGNTLTSTKRETALDALGQPLDTNFDGVINDSDKNPNPLDNTVTTVSLLNEDGSAFSSESGANPATLVFEEKLQRITTIGASFDMALDTDFAPVVLRGEFSYDKDVMQPIVNLDELAIGNITEALTVTETDMFKYVIGVDITVMTNLLVSTQLIQFYNLDFKDGDTVYTADPSTLSLTNGLNKGDEAETFVSFFLSKPFGGDGQHRWNNIIIAENGGGYWNRFDVEYGFNDELLGTFEVNQYWGDEDTTFGQFEKSSNIQLGLKYLF